MIQRAAFSAIIIVGALVLPLVMVGITLGIDHPQSGDASNPQPAVDDGHRVVLDAPSSAVPTG